IMGNQHPEWKNLHDGFQFGDSLLQLAIEVPDLLFGSHVPADVRRRPKPADHVAMRIVNRNAPREEPAITAVLPSNRKRSFPFFAGGPAILNAFVQTADMFWVVHSSPSLTLHLLEGGPCVVVPPLVKPKSGPIRMCHPG